MPQIILHSGQTEIFSDLFVEKTCRYAVGVCSRGWGKSYCAGTLAVNAINELLQLPSWVPNKNVYIIAPTYGQVTDIYYPLLNYELGMQNYATRSSKDLGRFWFPKGVELRLVSYEAIERLRGTGAYFVVCDEVSSWPGFKDAWQGIIMPCINTRWSPKRALKVGAKSPGRAAIISTPKGYTYLYDMSHHSEIDKDWKSYHFDYTTSPFLDIEEIEKQKDLIDPLTWAREYLALFEESGNNVFYCFDRKIHVTKDISPVFADDEEVHAAVDFNVGIMATSIFAIRGNQMHFIHELKGHPDTETLGKKLIALYPSKTINAYPDPTGNSRKTSAPVGVTDFKILKGLGIKVFARSGSPPIVDSVNAVNKKLKTASGIIDMYFRPECVGTIASVERTSWVDGKPDSATIDKTEGIEHFSDGVRYATEYLYPIRASTKTTVRGFNF